MDWLGIASTPGHKAGDIIGLLGIIWGFQQAARGGIGLGGYAARPKPRI
jgi:hypothetical protein